MMRKFTMLLLWLLGCFSLSASYAPSIFVPRQLSYNPILENVDVYSLSTAQRDLFVRSLLSDKVLFSAKPIYTQNVGSKFAQYFTIDHKSVLNVQENGTGDVDSLWFQVVTPVDQFYVSELSFDPKRITFGTMLQAKINFTEHVSFSVNTALINTRNTMNISEKNVAVLGTVPGLQTITQAFLNPETHYGAINGTQSKTGVDDIQLKFLYHSHKLQDMHFADKNLYWQLYLLAGIPTGQGSQALYLFEPLVGSRHAQVGLGGNLQFDVGAIKLQAEAKWRYAFCAEEIRSFDLTENGQWSRYLLAVNSTNTMNPYPAINNFTFPAQVTPQNSFDLYVAAYWDYRDTWHYEVGYDFWYRQAEKISVDPVLPAPSIGVADLYNIIYPTLINPAQSASTANISQGVVLGQNNAVSDTSFVAIQAKDFNLASAAAPESISNSVYGSIAYTKELNKHLVRTGCSFVYEVGHGIHVPNNIAIMLNIELLF